MRKIAFLFSLTVFIVALTAVSFAQLSLEQAQVRDALRFFRDRFNVRDVSGIIEEATNSLNDYPEKERIALGDTLWSLFDRLPPEVHLFFDIRSMDLGTSDATLEVRYYFKIKTLTAENRKFQAIKGIATLNLLKSKEKWFISRISPFILDLEAKIGH